MHLFFCWKSAIMKHPTEDGSHNSGFQTLLLFKEGEALLKEEVSFFNFFDKTTEKDCQVRMVAHRKAG